MGAIHAKIYHSVSQKSTIMNKLITLGCIQFRDILSGWFLGLFGKMVNWRTKEQYLGAVEFSICIHLSWSTSMQNANLTAQRCIGSDFPICSQEILATYISLHPVWRRSSKPVEKSKLSRGEQKRTSFFTSVVRVGSIHNLLTIKIQTTLSFSSLPLPFFQEIKERTKKVSPAKNVCPLLDFPARKKVKLSTVFSPKL